MLVVSRKTCESIVIGKNIKVTICKIKPGQVSVGIEAPKTVKILREELVKKS